MPKLLAALALLTSLAAVHGKGVLKLADRRLVAGDTARASGEKFPKAATLAMLLVGPSGRTRLSEIRTDTAGRFRVTPVVPTDLPAGAYRLIVVASDGDEVGALDVAIVPATERRHPAGHSGDPAEPSAQPLALERARSPWVTGGTLAGIVVAIVVGGLLVRRPNAAAPGLVILMATLLVSVASAQGADTAAVRRVVEAVAALSQTKDLAALDTLYAPDPWVRIIEGAGVNNGWIDYRDHHLKPELAEFENFRYRYFGVEPQVRGNVAWAAFRYELAVDTPRGHVEVDGRGTAVLEKRAGRWVIVHLHTSGRRRGAQ